MKNSVEFSRPIDLSRLGPGGKSYEIAATAEERGALARRFELLDIEHLAARVTLTPAAGGFYRLSATLEAALTQACVVTLDPVAARIEERFSLLYGALDAQKEVLLDGESETVEPLDGMIVDIAEAVAQQLSLALDPFPRAADAPEQAESAPPQPRLDSPFAALSGLRPARKR
ncbi:MAG: YceD family protein [Stellaceae bacterium]